MSKEGKDSVNQRLNLIVDTFEKGIKSAFAAKIGISVQGVHDLLSGRKGSPSFKVLSSILENYPTVDANWLVLGRGAMLQDETIHETYFDPTSGSGGLLKQAKLALDSFINSEEGRKQIDDVIGEKIRQTYVEHEALKTIYSLGKKYPYGSESQLSVRLGITEDEARELVLTHKIESMQVSKSEFRVTEQAVRDFLSKH